MKRIVCLFLLLALCVCLCACDIKITINEPNQDSGASDQGDPEVMAQLAGEWFGWSELEEIRLVLNADGTCVYSGTAATWKANYPDQFNISMGSVPMTFYVEKDNHGRNYLFAPAISPSVSILHRITDYTRVELTMDNWQQYFAIVNDGAYVDKNAFGDITGVRVIQTIRTKPQYNVAFPDSTNKPVVEYTYTTGTYQCTADMEKETFALGDLLEQDERTGSEICELFIGSDDGITGYAQIRAFGTNVNPYPVGEAVGLCTGFEITRIKGAIYIANE